MDKNRFFVAEIVSLKTVSETIPAYRNIFYKLSLAKAANTYNSFVR